MPAGDGRGLSPGDTTPGRVAPGRVFAGTSGFAYPDWTPRFYPAGLRGDGFLRHYATRLGACELNNTFYARPKPERIATWIAAVPDGFRFIVKGQRGATFRALFADPVDAIAWLTEPLPGFGSKLGGVLFRLDERTVRDDDRLSGLLRAWPPSIPLVVEAQHPSWHVDETFAASATPAPCSARPTSTTSRSRRRSAGRGLPVPAAPPLRVRGTRSWTPGRRASRRSSPMGWTRTSCSGMTRTGRPRCGPRDSPLGVSALVGR